MFCQEKRATLSIFGPSGRLIKKPYAARPTPCLLYTSNAQLGLSQTGQVFPQGVPEGLRLKSNLHLIAKGGIILGEADIMDREKALFAHKSIKILEDEAAGDLPGPIRPERCV